MIEQALKTDQNINANVLTDIAHDILLDNLKKYGNKPSKEHREALRQLLGLYSRLAFGESTGRFAVPLGTGLGKTQSIIAFISAIHRLGLDISLSVSASQVEALCDLKRELMKNGVPEDMIGLYHSYLYDKALADRYIKGEKHELDKGYASLPATQDHHTKPFLLITHNRVRGKGSVNEYNIFQGRPRNLMIYDESLFLSDCMSLELWRLKRATRWMEDTPGSPKALISYLWECISLFSKELERQQASNRDPQVITMPPLTNLEIDSYESSLPKGEEAEMVKAFLDMSQFPLRVYKSKESGLITYDLVVDRNLQNIVVLDASYPIRKLLHLNKDIQLEGNTHHRLVSYENVVVYQMPLYSGRKSFEKYLREFKGTDSGVIREFIDIILKIPRDQAVLIFTFKTRDKQHDFVKSLQKALSKAGIDLNETIEADVFRNGAWTKEPKRRVNFLTWGNETSLNRFSYCSNIIFAGVLHRSRLDLASHVVGQLTDIDAPLDCELLREIEESEVCQSLYQAMSRGSCRIIEGYKTKPMTVYLIHKYRTIRGVLDHVMPGLKWQEYKPKHVVSETKVRAIEKRLMDYLSGLGPEVSSISTNKIKKDLNMVETPRMTWTRAIREATEETGWVLVNRTLVRSTSLFT